MKTAVIIAASALLLSGMAEAAEIKVLSTQATQEAYLELVAQFEKATGHKVATVFTGTLNVQKRLADGEAYDLIIMAGPAILVRYKDGEKKIVVPPGAPIVRYEIGGKSDLKAGARFTVIAATRKPDGTLEANRIDVGRDGVAPQ